MQSYVKLYSVLLYFLMGLTIWCNEVQGSDHVDPEPSKILKVSSLLGEWTHSYEEEPFKPFNSPLRSPVKIFRPSGSVDFKPSLFRMRYLFKEENCCEWLVASPFDAHYMESCTWGLDPSTGIVTINSSSRVNRSVSFKIVELAPDMLRIEPLSR